LASQQPHLVLNLRLLVRLEHVAQPGKKTTVPYPLPLLLPRSNGSSVPSRGLRGVR
jgi:hypothetical protein